MPSCLVSGTLADVAGRRIHRATVAVRSAVANNRVQSQGGLTVGQSEVTTQTDEQGQFQVTLEQGLDIVIRIDEIGLHRQAKVPAQAAATLEELLDADV